MMKFKFRYRDSGPSHVHCTVFARQDGNEIFINLGNLCFSKAEWMAFRELVGRKAVRLRHNVEFETSDDHGTDRATARPC